MEWNWSLILACVGLFLALAGAYCASTLPLVKMLETARSYCGGDDKKWSVFEKELRRKNLLANCLLVLGTALQIWGAVLSQSPSDKTTAVSVAPPAPEAK